MNKSAFGFILLIGYASVNAMSEPSIYQNQIIPIATPNTLNSNKWHTIAHDLSKYAQNDLTSLSGEEYLLDNTNTAGETPMHIAVAKLCKEEETSANSKNDSTQQCMFVRYKKFIEHLAKTKTGHNSLFKKNNSHKTPVDYARNSPQTQAFLIDLIQNSEHQALQDPTVKVTTHSNKRKREQFSNLITAMDGDSYKHVNSSVEQKITFLKKLGFAQVATVPTNWTSMHYVSENFLSLYNPEKDLESRGTKKALQELAKEFKENPKDLEKTLLQPDNQGNLPIHRAIMKAQDYSHKINHNLRMYENDKYLKLASLYTDYIDLIELLLSTKELQKTLDCKNKEGKTPIDLAKTNAVYARMIYFRLEAWQEKWQQVEKEKPTEAYLQIYKLMTGEEYDPLNLKKKYKKQ